MPLVSVLISMGHNKTTGLPVTVLLLESFFQSSLPLPYGVLHLYNQSPSSRTLVTLNSETSWGWRKGGGWEYVDVACNEVLVLSPFVWGSLAGGLMLISLFHLRKKSKKLHRPKSLPPYQRFRTPFDQTTHKQKTHFKKPLASQTNVQNNEHLLKHKILITDWVASNFNHTFPSSKIVFIYVPESCP